MQETVRMHHPSDVSELAVEPRVRGIACVEDETLAAAETIGEEASVGRHLVLRVVRPVVSARDGDSSHESTVTIGRGSDIEDREEIRLRCV